jgi:hypothetical protein
VTLKEIQERINHIREISGDDELAHSHEDALYYEVLQAIANSQCADPAAAAKLVITTWEIKFARLCA